MKEIEHKDLDSFLNTGLKAVAWGREILQGLFGRPFKVMQKGTHYNLVTEADLACEKAIVKTIAAEFPAHNILAEEHKYRQTDSPFCWIIDPLDGTTNFVHHIPHYAISVALAYQNEILVGIVADPAKGETFYAVKGWGAFLNERPIQVSGAATLNESLLITGFYYERGTKLTQAMALIEFLLKGGIIDIRRFGAASLDLCYVACGRADGYFEYQLNSWDYAAGLLILAEAGGKITDYSGSPLSLLPSSVVGTNGLIHSKLLEAIGQNQLLAI